MGGSGGEGGCGWCESDLDVHGDITTSRPIRYQLPRRGEGGVSYLPSPVRDPPCGIGPKIGIKSQYGIP